MTELLKRGLKVAAAMTLLDLVFAAYVVQTAASHAAAAAAWAAGIVVLSSYVTRAYVDDRRMAVPAAFGAFVGTYLAVSFA